MLKAIGPAIIGNFSKCYTCMLNRFKWLCDYRSPRLTILFQKKKKKKKSVVVEIHVMHEGIYCCTHVSNISPLVISTNMCVQLSFNKY